MFVKYRVLLLTRDALIQGDFNARNQSYVFSMGGDLNGTQPNISNGAVGPIDNPIFQIVTRDFSVVFSRRTSNARLNRTLYQPIKSEK